MARLMRRYAGQASNDGDLGDISWDDESNATGIPDTVFATCSLEDSEQSSPLVGSDFDFTMPATARIVGITLVPYCTPEPDAEIHSVRLYLAGVRAGTDLGISAPFDSTPEYGGTANTWGLKLKGKDLRNAAFGVGLSATNVSGNDPVNLEVDGLELNAYWVPGGGFRSRERAFGRLR